MPSEEFTHEGTWLQWPHNFTYGSGAEDVESSWVQMTAALTPGERVHIIAYNEDEAAHITELLENAEIESS
jgi:agmatine deiminase